MSLSSRQTEDLTVIITTSPTPSAPSTELLSAVFGSFEKYCMGLLQCKLIIVFDTFDSITDQARLKKGCVTAEQANAFELYKANVKAMVVEQFLQSQELCFDNTTMEVEFGSPHEMSNSISMTLSQTRCRSVTFAEPERRLGFGLAVRSALRIADTKYVWVHQHDWVLTAKIPLHSLLQVIQTSTEAVPVKYVCFPSIRLLSYAVQHDTLRFSGLQALTLQLKRNFPTPIGDVPLTPLFFWHDKPHLAVREFYLARIFPSRYAMRRGEFIEDKVGQRARIQMKAGDWQKWATWLYYPDDGRQLCLQHLKGRVWRGVEGEERQKALWMTRQRAPID